MDGPFITVRCYRASTGKHGYRWTCQICHVWGINLFDRWTDHLLAGYGRTDVHPWRRCMNAVDVHLRRNHGWPPSSVNVTINIGS